MVIATTQPPRQGGSGVGFGRRPLRLDSVGPVAAQRAGLLFGNISVGKRFYFSQRRTRLGPKPTPELSWLGPASKPS